MLVLVTGGSGSGKSEFAENKAILLGGKRTYIAAMKPIGDEANRRITRHRLMRADKGFETIERYTDIKNLDVSGTALLECMSNLLANEMFGRSGKNAEREIMNGVRELIKKCDNLVIVTNEVSSDSTDYGSETLEYIKKLGTLNCQIAKLADEVYEVTCGIANRIK